MGALGLFERAYQAAQSPRALAQMGLAEQSLGKWVAASEHLKQALAASGDPWIAKNRSVLNDAVARVGDHVGWLEIFGGTPGAEVRLDGTPRGTLPLPGPITTTTGTLAIELAKGGHVPLRRTTSVRAGEKTREAFDALAVDSAGTPMPGDGGGRPNSTQPKRVADIARAAAPLPSVSAATPDLPEEQSSSQDPSAVTDAVSAEAHGSSAKLAVVAGTGALAAGALIFGVVEHVSWQDKVTSFDDMATCDPSANGYGSMGCAGLHQDALHARNLAFVGYGLAGILAATSAILFFAWDHDEPAQPRLACSGSPDLHGMDCVFRF